MASRNEEILKAMLAGETPSCTPQSRMEKLLFQLCQSGGGGGKSPTKLSELENDLFYNKKILLLEVTPDMLDENSRYVLHHKFAELINKEVLGFEFFDGSSLHTEKGPYNLWYDIEPDTDGNYNLWYDEYWSIRNGLNEDNEVEDIFIFIPWWSGDSSCYFRLYFLDSKKIPIEYCDTSEIEAELSSILDGGF